MSTSIYTYIPHFYIIQHINSGKYYAGVKYGGNANPDQLLKFNGYQTSSNVVKQIILEEGLESFVIRKIKVFETGEEALNYESRFLKRVNASFNNNFLNQSNNTISSFHPNYEKAKQTNLKKYECEYIFQNEDIKEKNKKTNLERYGYGSAIQSPEIKEKRGKTNLERYGYECSLQNEDIKEQIKQTNLERYGYEIPMQSEEVKEKYKQSCLERYGHEYSLQNEDVREKIKQTCLERYGVEFPSQLDEIKEKKKQTMIERYGCESIIQTPEIKEKRCKTNLERYGFENVFQSEEIKEKIKQSRINFMTKPIVLEIIKYRDKFKLKLGCGWYYKPQEFLDNLLVELKMTYGELI